MATFDMNWDAQAIAPLVIHPLAGSGRASPVEVVDLSADDSESADSDSVTSDYVDSCLGDEGYEPFGMLGACDFPSRTASSLSSDSTQSPLCSLYTSREFVDESELVARIAEESWDVVHGMIGSLKTVRESALTKIILPNHVPAAKPSRRGGRRGMRRKRADITHIVL
jgi:hypothetical protein